MSEYSDSSTAGRHLDDEHQVSSNDSRKSSSDSGDSILFEDEDEDGVWTTDHSEISGDDDESVSSAHDTVAGRSGSSGSGSDSNSSAQKSLTSIEIQLRDRITHLLSVGYKGPQIVTIIRNDGGKICLRTLTRYRKLWKLRQCDMLQKPPPTPLSPAICASVVLSHSQGLNLKEIQARLAKETGICVSICTIKQYLKRLNLQLLPNDVASGKVTIDDIVRAMNNARTRLLQDNAGYRRMRVIHWRQYSTRIPRQLVYEVLKQIDPKGITARLGQAFKRRIYRTNGPNHVWACNGHNKLKRFGITIYRFVDCWSRKILGMFVHVTNNNPRHVAVYFLRIASKAGGIPLKLTADYGSETVKMATLQMLLSFDFGGITKEEATKQMHYTKSVHNQKIELLWSQMMKQHNRSIKHAITTQVELGNYNPDDNIQKLLFQFLWIPVFQSSVDGWVDSYNHYRKRRDHLTSLPTSVTHEFAYSNPEYFGTTNQLLPIPVMQQLRYTFADLNMENIWGVFQEMLQVEMQYFNNHQ
ncbi:hypothetical protein MJO28_001142 [Puccinia striiformis f. sp. tritici]|uniref:Uncharacterized protein n=1 Tax=Puccinia striiformis f. sp. tritici TaxID=168172 RepID=A0ACC0F1H4_9BASI|nr:hypothetical protein MJO28_001142 [Puccinia striiformis f. sp. tritici]